MSENSKIEWTDHTFNPWEGCQKVGPGCDHCYAETRNARFGGGVAVNWGPGAPRRRTSAANWRKPLAWNANHDTFFAEHGRRQRVFCASLADVFDNAVSVQWRYDLLRLIMDTPNLDWLLLTKRIGNAAGMLEQAMRALTIQREGWADNYLPNVWLGATIVNQADADRDIPKLLATPAAVRFLSMEPLLGPVDLRNVAVPAEHDQLRRPWDYEGYKFNALTDHDDDRFHQAPATLDWVIVGGESGPGARPRREGGGMTKMLRWTPEQLAAHQARQPKPAPAVPAVVEDHQPAANLPECHFAVPGQPVPKGRARFARVGAGVRTFTPEKTARYENLVRMQADAAMQGREPMRGPIRLDVNVWLQVPASWSKKRRAAALAGDIAATKKPDADNVLKAVKDGMNGVVYADDSQVVEVRVSKRYSATPSVVVLATELNKESA